MSNHYFIMNLEIRVVCECCNERVFVKVDETLDCSDECLYDLDSQIKEALETQQADDGWLGDWCPRCAKNNAREVSAMADADAYCSRDKSQDIY